MKCEEDGESGEPEPECEKCPLFQTELTLENAEALQIYETMSALQGISQVDVPGVMAGPLTRERARTLVSKLALIHAFRGGPDHGNRTDP